MNSNSYFWQSNGTENNLSVTSDASKYMQSSAQASSQESLELQKSVANKAVQENVLYTQSKITSNNHVTTATDPATPGEFVNPDAIEPKPRSYTCRICQMTFPNKSAVTVHSRLHTDHQGKPYRCSFCDKGFSTNFYLKQHERIHSGQKPYKCPMCELSFKQLSHVQQHVRTHTGVRPYKCHWPGCGKAFLQQSHLKSHVDRHTPKTNTGEKPYKCHWPDCGKSFGQLTNLKSHVARHTPGKGKKRVNNQKKSEEKLNNTPSSSPLSLQDVINQAAAAAKIVPDNDVPDEAEIRPYLCPGCSKVYVREATFKKHLEECKTKLQLSISATASALGIDSPAAASALGINTPVTIPGLTINTPVSASSLGIENPASDLIVDYKPNQTSPERKRMANRDGGVSQITFTTHSTTDSSNDPPLAKRKYACVKEEPMAVFTMTTPSMGISGGPVFTSNKQQDHPPHNPDTVQSNAQNTLLHYGNETIHNMNASPSNSTNSQMRSAGNYILSHPQSETANIETSAVLPSSNDDLINTGQVSSTEHSTINQAAIQWQWDQPVPRLNFP